MTQDCESLTMMCARHLAGGWALGGAMSHLYWRCMNRKRILITLNDQGGAVMEWNYNELAATLRAHMASHPPVVVIEDDGLRNTRSRRSESNNAG